MKKAIKKFTDEKLDGRYLAYLDEHLIERVRIILVQNISYLFFLILLVIIWQLIVNRVKLFKKKVYYRRKNGKQWYIKKSEICFKYKR